MEKKTMGRFLSALRRAEGLTQKELAEKLNVSDKSVSRWERDEGVPDLALIPVIAEIFGVSCDELLRGERIAAPAYVPDVPDKKAEKQRQHLLASRLLRYKNQSLLSLGLILLGFLTAVVVNFAFLRAYLGFALGTVFFLAAGLLQLFFMNSALAAITDPDAAEAGACRRRVIFLAEFILGLDLILLCALLPLVVQAWSPTTGLTADSFWFYFGVFGLASLVIVPLLVCILNRVLAGRGVLGLNEAQQQTFCRNFKLARRCFVSWAAGCAVLLFCVNLLTGFGNPTLLCRKHTFNDWEEFKTFMETPVNSSDAPVSSAESAASTAVYYDETGREISEEEALTQILLDEKGNELGRFLWKNDSVIRYQHASNSLVPATVFTSSDWQRALRLSNSLLTGAALLCILAAGIPIAFYLKKRESL